MKRIRVSIALLALTLSIVAGAAQAQTDRIQPPRSDQGLAEFRSELIQNREHLTRAESVVGKMESEKRVTEEDSAAIDRELLPYATAIKAAYDRSTQQAQTAGKTKGKQGSVDFFLAFEEIVQADRKRVEQIQEALGGHQA